MTSSTCAINIFASKDWAQRKTKPPTANAAV